MQYAPSSIMQRATSTSQICTVRQTLHLGGVRGKVATVFSVRRCDRHNNEESIADAMDDYGPPDLAAASRKVLKLVLRDAGGHQPNMISLYLYDLWAEKCSFIR
jgi:hypothetical protein